MTLAVSNLLSIADQSAHYLRRAHDGAPDGSVRNAAAWLGRDLGDPAGWMEHIDLSVLDAFEDAMQAIVRKGAPLDSLTADDVPMGRAGPTLARWRRTLAEGRGFLVLRGVPVDRWDPATQKLFMRVIGLQFGRLGYQNPQGDVIGEVRDTGADKRDPYARLYATAGEFRFHSDASDLVGLLCVRPAKSGGESRVASSVSVYNELHRLRPDLTRLLFEPVPFDLRNEQAQGGQGHAYFTPCAHADGVLKTFYLSDYVRTVERLGVTLTAAQHELLDRYEAIAADPDVGLSFFLQPGDLQILNNHTMLHARTAFKDAPGQERLLLRFLVSMGA